MTVGVSMEQVFEQAWNNPAYTAIKLKGINVNQLLRAYDQPIALHFTRTMLWDVEVKKAWDPNTYIPSNVHKGRSWGRRSLENGDEVFERSSWQKRWLGGEGYDVEVQEQVYLNHKEQKATFIGCSTGKPSSQPLFHVEHAVEGEEQMPFIAWRVVHLTTERDPRLVECFKKFDAIVRLPEYIEVYIKRDLGLDLKLR